MNPPVYPSNVGIVKAQSVEALEAAININPVIILVQADLPVFQLYTGGIIKSVTCGTNVNHAILAVGYGTLNGIRYIKARNQWSAAWYHL